VCKPTSVRRYLREATAGIPPLRGGSPPSVPFMLKWLPQYVAWVSAAQPGAFNLDGTKKTRVALRLPGLREHEQTCCLNTPLIPTCYHHHKYIKRNSNMFTQALEKFIFHPEAHKIISLLNELPSTPYPILSKLREHLRKAMYFDNKPIHESYRALRTPLPKAYYDTLFEIQIALTQQYPANKESDDSTGNFEEPITLEDIHPSQPHVIALPSGLLYDKNSLREHFSRNTGYKILDDESVVAVDPMKNILTKREIRYLEQNDIKIHTQQTPKPLPSLNLRLLQVFKFYVLIACVVAISAMVNQLVAFLNGGMAVVPVRMGVVNNNTTHIFSQLGCKEEAREIQPLLKQKNDLFPWMHCAPSMPHETFQPTYTRFMV